MIIRKMRLIDVEQLQPLMTQLGYPATTEQLKNRFAVILEQPSYHTIVIENENQIIAFAGMSKQLAYEFDEPYVRILTFIVDEAFRRKKIGSVLLSACEEWAIESGCKAITLNSGNRSERQIAYLFYENLGYAKKSTGFLKSF